jgi:uncharacterized protein DUF4203
METFLLGLFALLIGAAFCFAGYRFILILLPIWGLFAGFSIGASAVVALFGGGFLSTATSWIVGIVVGLVFAVLAYLFYYAAVAILGATVGYSLGAGFIAWIGGNVAPNFFSVIAGVVVAVLVAGVILLFNVPKMLLIVLSALGGASAVVTGFLLMTGQIQLEALRYGVVGALLEQSWFWSVVWIVLAAAGLVVQWESSQRYTLEAEAYPM